MGSRHVKFWRAAQILERVKNFVQEVLTIYLKFPEASSLRTK